MKNQTEETGTNASGRADYKVGEVSLNGKVIGSAKMAMSLKNLDIPSTMSLMQIYQTKLQPYERAAAEAAAAGEPPPELNLTPAEEAQVKTGLEKLLAAGPQVALENLSFNTSNGESRANLVLDLTKPQSMDLPPDQLVKQLIALLDFNLLVSKPMLVDVLTVQSQIDGQTDAKLIADQASATADMFSSMAVGTQLAKLDGNNVVTKLHYANNQVDFNGQKMTLEEFVGFVMSKLGGTGQRHHPVKPQASTQRPASATRRRRAFCCLVSAKHSPVGASLLAMTAVHSISMSADPSLSRAGSLPHGFAPG